MVSNLTCVAPPSWRGSPRAWPGSPGRPASSRKRESTVAMPAAMPNGALSGRTRCAIKRARPAQRTSNEPVPVVGRVRRWEHACMGGGIEAHTQGFPRHRTRDRTGLPSAFGYAWFAGGMYVAAMLATRWGHSWGARGMMGGRISATRGCNNFLWDERRAE